MNISYTYRPTYLITYGIGFIILVSLVFISINFSIYNDFLGNEIIQFQIFLILNLTIEPIIIGWGVYNIIKGNNQYEIQFSKQNFILYKNFKLEIEESVEKVEKVNIISVNISSWNCWVEYIKIEIELIEMENFQLVIRGKKWIARFLKFEDSLGQYCSEKQVPIVVSFHDDISRDWYFYLKEKY